MSLHVLLIAGSYPPGRCGVGDYTACLATALADTGGLEVSVLTTGDDPAPAHENGVAVHRALPDWSLHRTGAFLRLLRRISPDIVHVQYPTQGYGAGGLPWIIPLLARAVGARVVQTWHEGYDHDLGKFSLLAAAPGPIVVVRDAFLNQFGRGFRRIAGLRRLLHINGASTLPARTLSPQELAAVRARHGAGDRRLVVFFGFVHPSKQVEQLFAIADPDTDHILVVGDHGDRADYLQSILERTCDPRWAGHAAVIGFVEPNEAAAIVAAADALVLPLKAGAGLWNTAVLAGILQRSFVLTTSAHPGGYDAATNVYHARVDDLVEMRQALKVHAGTRRAETGADIFTWPSVASRHRDLYRSLRSPRAGAAA